MLTALVLIAIAAVFIAMLLGTAGVHDEANPPPKPKPIMTLEIEQDGQKQEIGLFVQPGGKKG